MREEISLEELNGMEEGSYLIADMRDEESFRCGRIDGAVLLQSIPLKELPKDKLIVLYCRSGIISLDYAASLREEGFDAVSLKEGYIGYLRERVKRQQTSEFCKDVEDSIRKKFHKQLWSRFTAAINEYKLVEEKDKIAVCISGGKDSMLMAKLFQELKRHNKFPFELVFLVMDPGYSAENREIIEKNAASLNIPITVFETDIFESVYRVEESPCYLCARMRRGYLYNEAKKLGCNKIALGHHYDDVIETILMGMLYGGQVQTMMPKLKSNNFEGMQLIRPLYFIREEDIKRWRDYNGLGFIRCACRFTDTCTSEACQKSEHTGSKRKEIKNLIAELKKTNPFVEKNIFKSVQNVNLKTIIAYKDEDGTHSFLDNFTE